MDLELCFQHLSKDIDEAFYFADVYTVCIYIYIFYNEVNQFHFPSASVYLNIKSLGHLHTRWGENSDWHELHNSETSTT